MRLVVYLAKRALVVQLAWNASGGKPGERQVVSLAWGSSGGIVDLEDVWLYSLPGIRLVV